MTKVVFKPVGLLGWLNDLTEFLPRSTKDGEVIEMEFREGAICFTHQRTSRRVTVSVINNMAYMSYIDPACHRAMDVQRSKDFHKQIAEEIHFYFQGVK